MLSLTAKNDQAVTAEKPQHRPRTMIIGTVSVSARSAISVLLWFLQSFLQTISWVCDICFWIFIIRCHFLISRVFCASTQRRSNLCLCTRPRVRQYFSTFLLSMPCHLMILMWLLSNGSNHAFCSWSGVLLQRNFIYETPSFLFHINCMFYSSSCLDGKNVVSVRSVSHCNQIASFSFTEALLLTVYAITRTTRRLWQFYQLDLQKDDYHHSVSVSSSMKTCKWKQNHISGRCASSRILPKRL